MQVGVKLTAPTLWMSMRSVPRMLREPVQPLAGLQAPAPAGEAAQVLPGQP